MKSFSKLPYHLRRLLTIYAHKEVAVALNHGSKLAVDEVVRAEELLSQYLLNNLSPAALISEDVH